MARQEFSRSIRVAAVKRCMVQPVTCASCGRLFDRGYRISLARASRPQFCTDACRNASWSSLARARLLDRFWSKVERRGSDDCWLWRARRDRNGYGRFQMKPGKPWLAHRAAYFFARSEDPAGRDVCHSCDNPPCCNPQHLWLGDAKANVADMIAKGRRVLPRVRRGNEVNTTRLTAEKALAIVASPEPDSVLAALYAVTAAAIYNVRHGRSWSHVTGVPRD